MKFIHATWCVIPCNCLRFCYCCGLFRVECTSHPMIFACLPISTNLAGFSYVVWNRKAPLEQIYSECKIWDLMDECVLYKPFLKSCTWLSPFLFISLRLVKDFLLLLQCNENPVKQPAASTLSLVLWLPSLDCRKTPDFSGRTPCCVGVWNQILSC